MGTRGPILLRLRVGRKLGSHARMNFRARARKLLRVGRKLGSHARGKAGQDGGPAHDHLDHGITYATMTITASAWITVDARTKKPGVTDTRRVSFRGVFGCFQQSGRSGFGV